MIFLGILIGAVVMLFIVRHDRFNSFQPKKEYPIRLTDLATKEELLNKKFTSECPTIVTSEHSKIADEIALKLMGEK